MTVNTAPAPFPRQQFINWVRPNLGEARYQEFLEIEFTFQKLVNRAVDAGHAAKGSNGIEWQTMALMQEYLDNQWPEELRRQKYYWAQTKRDWLKTHTV